MRASSQRHQMYFAFFSPVFQTGLIWDWEQVRRETGYRVWEEGWAVLALFLAGLLGLESAGARIMLIQVFECSVANVNYKWVSAYFVMHEFVSNFLSTLCSQMKQKAGWWADILSCVLYYNYFEGIFLLYRAFKSRAWGNDTGNNSGRNRIQASAAF